MLPCPVAMRDNGRMARAERSAVDLRMDPRLVVEGAWIEIDGRRFDVRDVSLSGVLIQPYDGAHAVGGSFSFQLHLPDKDKVEVVIKGGAVVVRLAEGVMAAQFFYLDADQYPAFDAYLERRVTAG
jgi:hypothetical protein